jgi:hypothetical protein
VARRGEVLRKIGNEFGGVVVSLPRAGVTSDRVNLKGARNCVDAAKARILDIVQDLEEQVTIDCEIPQQYHRCIFSVSCCTGTSAGYSKIIFASDPDPDPFVCGSFDIL